MVPKLNSSSAIETPGAALKALRLERGWTLNEVSIRTGVPTSTLSKIENGKTEITMDRLLRISVALEVNIADLFAAPATEFRSGERGRRSITHLGDGNLVKSPYGEYCYHAQDLLEKRASPLVAEIRARTIQEFGELHRHIGDEFLYVLEGELALHTDTYAPLNLKAGESIYFDSEMGHAYLAVGDQSCRILSICIPPGNGVVRTCDDAGWQASHALPSPVRRLRPVD